MSWFTKKEDTTVQAFNIFGTTIEKLYPIVDEYVDWYCDHGISLPQAYELDPSGWTEVLRKIQRAFELKATEKEEGSELMLAIREGNQERLDTLYGEIKTGFSLFGKHLPDLYDKYGVPDDYGREVTH